MISWVEGVFSVAFWFYSQIYGWRLIDRNVYSVFTCNSAMISEKWKGQIAARGRTKFIISIQPTLLRDTNKWSSEDYFKIMRLSKLAKLITGSSPLMISLLWSSVGRDVIISYDVLTMSIIRWRGETSCQTTVFVLYQSFLYGGDFPVIMWFLKSKNK